MTAVPGVPVEAIRAASIAFCSHHPAEDDSAHCVDQDRMARALTAALPSLREVIAAEAKADAWHEAAIAWSEAMVAWYEPSSTELLYWPDVPNPYRAALSAPVQPDEATS